MIDKIFTCKKCGHCCHGGTTVSLDNNDQKRMLKILGISREEALKRFWRVSGTQIQMKTVDEHCVFYDGGCSIHPGRPWRCRQWPFVNAILSDKSNLTTISNSCPGFKSTASYPEVCDIIKKGGLLDDKEKPQSDSGK